MPHFLKKILTFIANTLEWLFVHPTREDFLPANKKGERS